MKWNALSSVVVCCLIAGCAPQYIDVPSPVIKKSWVQRDALETHSTIGSAERREVVLAVESKNQFLSPDERVIWTSGIDISNSRLQRGQQRGVTDPMSVDGAESRKRNGVVDIYEFTVDGAEVSIDSLLKVEKFKALPKARYYVEFLNKEEMSESGVEEMMSAWRGLSKKLKDRGMDMSNVVMGSSKYGQGVNEIVLIRVGK